MADNQSLRGTLNLLVLGVLSRRKRLSGYAIQQAIEMTSKGKLPVKDSSLYPALDRMHKAGWVLCTTVRKNGQDASLWQLSSEGEKQFDAEKLRWEEFRLGVYGVLRRRP
jgi:DNA-binding PadR family transcriptional regulator